MSTIPLLESTDGHFLAGFIDAEGCFQIRANNGAQSWRCVFTLALRDDDAEILVELQRLTGLGALTQLPAPGTSRPQVVWSIQSWPDCARLAELLERFPLRGHKRREAAVWAEAVRELGECPRPDHLPRLAAEIRSLKRYVNLEWAPGAAPRHEAGLLSYLGGFFTGEGHLYLSGSRCRLAVRLRDDDRPLRARARCRRRCSDCPRVSLLRAEHDKSLPCLSRVYDLFPGGWGSVTTTALAESSLAACP